jgi:DegV family protein with EDD domain
MEMNYPHIRVVVMDTLNVAMCHGWMVIEAARKILEGGSIDHAIQRVEEMIPITKMIQTADTLKYLYMGGRIGRASHLVGSMLKIKPLIGMEQGEIVPLGTARTRKRAYQKMVDLVVEKVGESGKIKIAYVHAAAQSEVKRIQEIIESRITVVESLIAELSPALGVHTGPGTAGLCYFPV